MVETREQRAEARRVAAAERRRAAEIDEAAAAAEEEEEAAAVAAAAAAAANAGGVGNSGAGNNNPAGASPLELLQMQEIQQRMEHSRMRIEQETAEHKARLNAATAGHAGVNPGYHVDPVSGNTLLSEFLASPAAPDILPLFPNVSQSELAKLWRRDPMWNPVNLIKLLEVGSFSAPPDEYESTIGSSGKMSFKLSSASESDYGETPYIWSASFLLWKQIRLQFDKDLTADQSHFKFHARICYLAGIYQWPGVLLLAIKIHTRNYRAGPAATWVILDEEVAHFCRKKGEKDLLDVSSGGSNSGNNGAGNNGGRRGGGSKRTHDGRVKTDRSKQICWGWNNGNCSWGNCERKHVCAVEGCGSADHKQSEHKK